jgi:eukaryotic-like serine/threonine-protein kinase
MPNGKKCFFTPGATLNDKWVILDLIGKGAMGEVYRAHQLILQRDVAIKIISKEWLQTAEEEGLETETIIQRFHREFQAMAKVRHPNVLQIYDYGAYSILKDEKEVDIEYIAMEYIPGATLRFTMSDEGFEPDEKLIKHRFSQRL